MRAVVKNIKKLISGLIIIDERIQTVTVKLCRNKGLAS